MASTTRELLANVGTYPFSAPEAAPRPETWVDPQLSGGGYGQAQLSHALGIALWITGLRAADVFALMSAPMDAPVELHDEKLWRDRAPQDDVLAPFGPAMAGSRRFMP